MSNRGQTGIPIMETIFADDLLLIFRLIDFTEIDTFGFGICCNQVLAMLNIFFF